MKDSSTYNIASTLSILLVGDPKTGKSCVAGAFPAPYFLEVDNNLDSVVRVMEGKKFWYDLPTQDVKDAHEVWKKCLANIQEAVANPDVKTIVIDSISLLSEFMCAWIIQEHARMGDMDKNGKPTEAMTIPDYGKLLTMFRKLIFGLRASGKFVVVTSHQQVSQNELTKAPIYALAIPGQAKDSLAGMFSDAWATMTTIMPMNKIKYEIRTAPTGFHVALGTSVRSLPRAMDITDKTPGQIWAMLSPLLSIAPKSGSTV